MFAINVINVPAAEMLLPASDLEIRTVPDLIVLDERCSKIASADLPNLALEYKDGLGETSVIWYNVKNMGRVFKPFRFDELITVFAEQVGQNFSRELVKRAHNSKVKGIKSRLKDLANDLYSPQLGARNMIDTVKAPRILRCQKETTQFKAFRHMADMKEFMRQKYIYGITGFFKLGDTVGYFVIEGLVAPLWCPTRDGQAQEYIISDVQELVDAYRTQIFDYWPFLSHLELTMELTDSIVTDHFELNRLAGEHFSSQSGKK